MKTILRFSVTFFLMCSSSMLFAFPEMVRHGYVNCTTCHVGPNGGGVLTTYGRGLSRELLSTWGTEDEGKFLYGVVKPPTWLELGGDIRALQTYVNSSRIEQAKFILMQADAEAAVSFDKFQLVSTVGRQEGTSYNKSGGAIFSRRHFVSYRPNDRYSLRAGRFQTAYGINLPDHTTSVKRNLNWDEGSETYNLEGAWLGENMDAFATISIGRPDTSSVDGEKGFALRSSVAVQEQSKIGLSYFYGTKDTGKRHVFGPYAIVGFTRRIYLLAELDFQRNLPKNTDQTWGFVDYLQLNYEFFKGIHGYVSQELARLDWKNGKNATETYSLGARLYPRPHFELLGAYQRQRKLSLSADWSDVLWFQIHLYL